MQRPSFILQTFLCALCLLTSYQSLAEITTTRYERIDRERVGRATFRYTFQIHVQNDGPAVTNVVGHVTSSKPTVTIETPSVPFGDIPAGGQAVSLEHFIMVVDRRTPIGNAIQWQFEGQTQDTGTILLDNADASTEIRGDWAVNTSDPGFYGADALTGNSTGEKSVTWQPELSEPGRYTISAQWPNGHFTDQATYVITTLSGNQSVTVDQSVNGGRMQLLGTFDLGTDARIAIGNAISGTVAADAVQLVRTDALVVVGTPDSDELITDESAYVYGLGGPDTLTGSFGDDELHGGDDNDQLQGLDGVDLLSGGPGDDTYIFGRGDGHDFIRNDRANLVESDTLQFSGNLTAGDIDWAPMLDDLVFTIVDTDETVTVSDWYRDWHNQLSTISFETGDHLLIEPLPINLDRVIAAYDFEGDLKDVSGQGVDGTVLGEIIYTSGENGLFITLDSTNQIDLGAMDELLDPTVITTQTPPISAAVF